MARSIQFALAIALVIGAGAIAQPAPTPAPQPFAGSDTVLPLEALPGHDAIVTQAVFSAGQEIKTHRHPGIEMVYGLAGETIFQAENERARTIKAGDTLTIPAGTYHRAKAGSHGAKILIVRVHPKGQPLRIPPDRPVRFPE